MNPVPAAAVWLNKLPQHQQIDVLNPAHNGGAYEHLCFKCSGNHVGSFCKA